VSALLAQVEQGLFLLFMLVCTSFGITGLIWCVVQIAGRIWLQLVAAGTLRAAIKHVQREEREALARSFGTPRDG